ncbi:3-oxoacyl-[acyl-carrier-protein] synthase III C-terminal domain-containing protein [Pantoea sp. FN0307]|uniref:3-oxoacyl-[acyl-carrier-protein] synthase III C-terminal domain-containing protein n=1 Tax=Pantoea sp. FN0307 TaxID=3418560 RepID=UPI003CEC68D8
MMKILSIGHHLTQSGHIEDIIHPNKLQLEAIRYAGYDQFWTTPYSVREMAFYAARNALEEANISSEDIGFIIAGFSGIPDFIGIDLACQVGAELQCHHIRTINLMEGCGSAISVWMQAAIMTAELPAGKNGLVVLAQRISDPHQDRFGLMNAVLSDGAVAAVVGKAHENKDQPGFLYIAAEDISDCRYVDMMRIEYGGGYSPWLPEGRDSRHDKLGRERIMDNYNFSAEDLMTFLQLRVDNSVNIIQRVLLKSGNPATSPFLLHTLEGSQSIKVLCQQTGLAVERSNLSLLPELGHVGCADPLLSLHLLYQRGKISLGDEIVMSTISTGLKWGASLFKYGNVA